MKKFLLAMAALAALLAVLLPNAAAHEGNHPADMVREFNDDGTAAAGDEVIGTSKLIRRASGLKASVHVEGLIPGGVYTFWWVVPEDLPPDIPGGVFVARGAGAVAGPNGKATVHMSASTGQPGIEGFPVLEGAEWGALVDPLNDLVRVEIAYHGQAADAGADLDAWLSDFWTGSVCPPNAMPVPSQPHCPVFFAATHVP